MRSLRDRVSQETQAQLNSHLMTTAALMDKTVDGIEQLSDLHINLARVTFEQANLAARQLIAAEDTRQFLVLSAAQWKPHTGRMFDYTYYLTTIASGMQAEFIKVLGARIVDANRRLAELAEDIGKTAPAGCKSFVAWIKSLADSANAGYAEWMRAAQRTARARGAGADAVATQAARAAIRNGSRSARR